jgi:hypothetical protein
MIGFQPATVELELAKTVRADDLAAAKRFQLARLARGRGRGSARAKNLGSLASTTRPARPAAGSIAAPRRSSG